MCVLSIKVLSQKNSGNLFNESCNWSFFIASIKPRPKPLYYAIWDILENKTNETSHPNFGSLKTVFEKEWNKMPEEFILKAHKSFQSRVDTIVVKKMVTVLSKYIVLRLSSYFDV